MAVVAAVASVLEDLKPQLPLEVGDCAAVFERVRSAAPAPYTIDVYHDSREIRVEVRLGHERVIQRVLRP